MIAAAAPTPIRGERQEVREPPAPPFKSIAAFCKEYEPLAYVVDKIVQSRSLYTVTGKTGHGKTGIFVSTAFAIATGKREILGREVETGRVAYVAMENPDDARMRMMMTAFRWGLSLEDLLSRIVVCDRRLKPEELVAHLSPLAVAEPFRLIMIDSLAAAFDGSDINDNVQGGEFMRRLRPLTRLPGQPATLITAHPVKNATQDQLLPYGGGAILNEVDGNLTTWKADAVASLHWQGKLRGLEFQPAPFKFELCGSPDVLDVKGLQVQIPVCVPTTEEAAEERAAGAGTRTLAVLKAIHDEPKATQRKLMAATGLSSGTLSRTLEKLAEGKFIEKSADDRYRPTPKGRREIEASDGRSYERSKPVEQNAPVEQNLERSTNSD